MLQDDLLDDNSLLTKYSYASLEQRVMAGGIDLLFFGALHFTFKLGLEWMGSNEQYIWFLWLVVLPVYKLMCDGTNGYTLGKWFAKIQLVQDKENFPPVGWFRAWKRVLLFLPLVIYFIIYVFFDMYVDERLSRHTTLRTLSETSILINNLYRFCNHFEWPWMAIGGASMLTVIFTRPSKTLYDFFAETVCIKTRTQP
ncbi:MAG: RDD family protein [Aureispira sp.]